MAGRRPELPRHARRWDAVVLGSALPGLVAAARIAVRGQRVLIVEEAAAAEIAPPVREPFFLAGARGGVLDACLKDLGLPLIERRALEPYPVALQMILPNARVDVGEPQRTVDEWVAWGIAKPEEARALLRALATAAEAELEAMMTSPIVKAGGLRALARGAGRSGKPSLLGRGLPDEVASAEGRAATLIDALGRALSHWPEGEPPPEARARLLGTPLAGGAWFPTSELGVRELLLRRIRSRHGEIRTVGAPFCFAAAGQHPALAVDGVGELWAGRVLVMNAPASALAERLREWDRPVPAFLSDRPVARHRRVTRHLSCRSDALPEGMGRALVRIAEEGEAPARLTLARHPRPEREDEEAWEDLVAQAIVGSEDDEAAAADGLEAAVRDLIPFAGDRLVGHDVPRPGWDDDGVLALPPPQEGWPGEIDTRVSSRPPVHLLARESLGSLGLEGELLLGWRAGDAIAQELA